MSFILLHWILKTNIWFYFAISMNIINFVIKSCGNMVGFHDELEVRGKSYIIIMVNNEHGLRRKRIMIVKTKFN